MRAVALFAILFAPLVALAQNNNNDTNNGGNSQSVQVSTSFSQSLSFDGNRQPHTISQPVAVTITQAASPAPSSNSTGNSTNPGNSTSSQPTSTGPLPTAPTNVDGGGNGPHGAPMPGQEGSNGEFGPGDGYITSGVMAVERNAILVSIAGMAVGGAFALW